MDCAYALPYQLGSHLLEKIYSTSSNYFNMQLQKMSFEARTMEESVGPVADPKSLTIHKSYNEYGPVALCSTLQTIYASLLKSKKNKKNQRNHKNHKSNKNHKNQMNQKN